MTKLHFTIIIQFVIIAAMLFFIMQDGHQDNDKKHLQAIDSLMLLNEQSLNRTLALESSLDSLEGLKMAELDSLKARQIGYKNNQKQYDKTHSFINSASDSAYHVYITDRQLPKDFLD